ncbi:MAG TPA: hypothetical protein PKY28_08555, partial [Ferruginibacter sp.]|nr:hypothetical protein [Ferruginibacter sp.]
MKSFYFFLTAFLFLPGHDVYANEFTADKSYICTVPVNFTDSPVKDEFSPPPPPVLTRGPYLQVGTQTSIIIRWRTD